MSNKLINCKTCGAEVAKSARICPSCGAKVNKKHPVLGALLVIIGIIAIIGAMGGEEDTPQKVDTSPSVEQELAQESEKVTFSVGETVALNDIVVTYLSAKESSGSQFNRPEDGTVFLLCNFEIENNSSSDIAVSSLISFEAYADDYATSMNLSALIEAENPQLDGVVAAGKKMKGTIAYQIPSDWKEFEINFTPDFWTGEKITFIAEN